MREDLGGVGYQRDAGVAEEVVLAGVHFPAEQRRVHLLEHPTLVVADQDRGVAAVEDLVLALEPARERGTVAEPDTARIFHHRVHGVFDLTSILPLLNATKARDRDGQRIQIPTGGVDGVDADFAG